MTVTSINQAKQQRERELVNRLGLNKTSGGDAA